MRRTLASPILAISSNSPSTIFAEALSASIRTARRGERGSAGMIFPLGLTRPLIQEGSAIGRLRALRLHLDSGIGNHLAPARNFLGDEAAKFVRRAADGDDALIDQLGLQRGI